ncbi:hypothetical protein PO883_31105, partial [Massilia sp. DJPM01]|uniref:hypothetical protein n=1 Tax=Massilia sp. DJPM01 TaxID=3024404 RepID=UPI00259D70F5
MIGHAIHVENVPRVADSVLDACGDFDAQYDSTLPHATTAPSSNGRPVRDRTFSPSRPIPATHTTSAGALKIEESVAGEISV